MTKRGETPKKQSERISEPFYLVFEKDWGDGKDIERMCILLDILDCIDGRDNTNKPISDQDNRGTA